MSFGVKCACAALCVCKRGERMTKGVCKRQRVSISKWVRVINLFVTMIVCVCVCQYVSMCLSVCGCRQTLTGSWPCHSVSHKLSDVVWGCGLHYEEG